jgi:tripartite-type tricarboxylate transporter receptor subunit TctC
MQRKHFLPATSRFTGALRPRAATDATARIVGEHMAATLGRNVLIENVTGGSGLIATTRVARAAPDGHTLLLHQQALAANVSLFPKAPFDVERDLAPVGLVNTTPMIIVGRRTLRLRPGELAAWMKQAGQQVKFTNGGVGSLNHLCAALFAQAVGVEVDMIPYRGGAPAVADILAGHADLFCGSATLVSEQIIARNIKGYGISARERLASLPDIPTLAEQGFMSIDIELWHALFVPSATPRAIIDRLNQALRAALDDPKVIKSFAVNEATVFPSAQQSPEAAAALVHAEIIRWGEIIRANKIEAAHNDFNAHCSVLRKMLEESMNVRRRLPL